MENNTQQKPVRIDVQQKTPAPVNTPESAKRTAPTVPAGAPSDGAILAFGIVGLACTCTFFLSLLGVIFSGIALSKANTFYRLTGQLWGRSKTGRILAKFGMGFGIPFLILSTIVIVILIIAGILAVNYGQVIDPGYNNALKVLLS